MKLKLHTRGGNTITIQGDRPFMMSWSRFSYLADNQTG